MGGNDFPGRPRSNTVCQKSHVAVPSLGYCEGRRLEQPLDDALRAIAESILIFERSWSVLATIPWKFNDVYVFAYIGPVFASFLQVTGLICYAMLTRTCNYSDTILRQ